MRPSSLRLYWVASLKASSLKAFTQAMSRRARSAQTLEIRSLCLDYSAPYAEVLSLPSSAFAKIEALSIDAIEATHIAVLIRNVATNTSLLTLKAKTCYL